LTAYRHRPAKIEPIPDIPSPFDYPRDIQPIWDRHCVRCHNADRYDGRVDMTGDHLAVFSMSYRTISDRHLVADGRNLPFGDRAPRTIGSSASRLMKLIDGSHYDAKLSDQEQTWIRLWIESSATYAGTYAGLGCGMYFVPLPRETLQGRCVRCHKGGDKEHALAVKGHSLETLCNLDRPPKSLLLRAPLAASAGGLEACGPGVFQDTLDPDYQKLLAAIQVASRQLAEEKRFDMPGFRPNRFYLREMRRWGFLPPTLQPQEPVDYYAVDQAYWKSFWWRPVAAGGKATTGALAP